MFFNCSKSVVLTGLACSYGRNASKRNVLYIITKCTEPEDDSDNGILLGYYSLSDGTCKKMIRMCAIYFQLADFYLKWLWLITH